MTHEVIDTSFARPYAGGCIRFTPEGPRWHVNDRHWAVGFDPNINPVILSNGRLHLTMLRPLTVVSAGAFPDETLTEREISAGISGAVGDCNISMVKRGMGRRLQLDDPDEYAEVVGEYSNLWALVWRIPEPTLEDPAPAG